MILIQAGVFFHATTAALSGPDLRACAQAAYTRRRAEPLRASSLPASLPITHRRAIRATNLLERLFVGERRRLKIIPNALASELS
jgi:hypothetical protein